MAHEIESIAWANEVPWHGLGVKVSEDVSCDEMLKAAGLDWSVDGHPIYTKIGDQQIKIPGRKAFIRSSDNKLMTVAGDKWTPLQNSDMLNFFQRYAEAGGCKLETAGSLRGGQVVWALANLNHGFKVGGNDDVRGYLLFTSPHKVGEAIKVRTTTIRVVCANTMALAERLTSGASVHYSQSHMKEFDFDKAHQRVEAAHEALASAARRAETLHDLKISTNLRMNLLGRLFGTEEIEGEQFLTKRGSAINASILKAPGAEPDTGWGFLNGVTHWADHVNGHNNATRMFRSWVGDIAKAKQDVEAALLELAQ